MHFVGYAYEFCFSYRCRLANFSLSIVNRLTALEKSIKIRIRLVCRLIKKALPKHYLDYKSKMHINQFIINSNIY